MKFNKIFLALTGCFLMASCSDLDTVPQGSTVLDSQKDASMLSADVNGLNDNLITVYTTNTLSDNSNHNDFGLPAVTIFLEGSGQDFVADNAGYNWFRTSMTYADRVYTSFTNRLIWRLFYNHIRICNDLISVIDPESEDATVRSYLGQAYVSRAFAYFYLIQSLQFTYVDHKDKPGVPIVKEDISDEQKTNNPRATVGEVYDLILSDANKAVELLEGYTPSSNKYASEEVAYGLRARIKLVMQDWAGAAQDAQRAQTGYTPYSIEEVSAPTFNDATNNNSWMWAAIVSETNRAVTSGLINFPSHMSSLSYGYTTGTDTYRSITNTLWEQISSTDVRKGWWVDENLSSPLTDDLTVESRGQQVPVAIYYNWVPYTNVKFGAYKNEIGNDVPACDFPIMRVEEMFLIQAEGLAMSGNVSGAVTVLENFVKTYRNPEYVCRATTAQAVQEEVWFQRRIELWGEGFSFFDLLRLKKPLDRKGTNYPEDVQFTLPAEAPIFLYRIPSEEINANNGISPDDNNEAVPAPSV